MRITDSKAGLNSFQLKVLAMASMLVDHVGALLFPENMVLRCIGRLSFPIFCFLLVEGFFHTRNVYKYMTRLGIFALVSEIPYDLAFYGTVFEPGRQNIFFTLFIGLAVMCILEFQREWIIKILEIMLAMWFAEIFHTDYGFKGILLICWFYLLKEHLAVKLLGGALWNFLTNVRVQYYGAAAMIPIGLYNGRKGPGMKYFFYAFYPVHLLMLYCVQRILA